MNARQIELVQESWAQVEPIADTAARLFYLRLFHEAPHLRDRVKTSMSEQGDRLVHAVREAVDGLPSSEDGVVDGADADAAIVGDSLLWAFEQLLGRAFTTETRDAWVDAYAGSAGRQISAWALPSRELVDA